MPAGNFFARSQYGHCKLLYPTMTWHTVTTEPNLLGESPFWHPQEKRLYWVDVPGKLLQRLDVASGVVERWAMPSEPGCIAPAASGGLVVALREGIYRAPVWGGDLQLLAAAPYDPATTRFNDGKCDPLGRFWASTIYEPRDARKAELYCLEAGRLSSKAGNAITGNGLAWSPDTKTLYWSDTPHHIVHAWDWDAASNVLSNYREFLQMAPKPAGWQAGMPGYGGRPDGAAVDVQGNYYSAQFEGQRLCKFSPDGELLKAYPLPVRCPTMPCFGGDDLQTLYLTSGRHGRSDAELAALPASGHVLSLRVDVPGLPVNFFKD
jgi:sugar lactone lactonase YvrE